MLYKLNKNRAGFTLVEIMTVVAIIALLATIAAPNFLRARKRAQASWLLEEMRIIDGAKDVWAAENNKGRGTQVTWNDLVPYFKSGSRLAAMTDPPRDILGNIIATNGVNEPPTIAQSTYDEFFEVLGTNPESFWGSFYSAGS